MKKYITTDIGEAIYPHLTGNGNTKFENDGVFELSLRLPQMKADILIANIIEATKEQVVAMQSAYKFNIQTCKKAATPWKPSVDKDKNPIAGYMDFKIKQNRICGKGEKQWTFTPDLFDASAQPLNPDTQIGSGSKVIVVFEPNAWWVKNELGFNLRLKAVQVVDLVTGNARTAAGYGLSPLGPEKPFKPLTAEEKAALNLDPPSEDESLSNDDFMKALRSAVNV